MTEQELELRDTQLAAMLGWHKFKGSGGEGDPDSIYVKQGRVFTVERKRPGRLQQANQVKFQKFMQDNGTDYYVVDDSDHEQIRKILIEQEERWFGDGIRN